MLALLLTMRQGKRRALRNANQFDGMKKLWHDLRERYLISVQ